MSDARSSILAVRSTTPDRMCEEEGGGQAKGLRSGPKTHDPAAMCGDPAKTLQILDDPAQEAPGRWAKMDGMCIQSSSGCEGKIQAGIGLNINQKRICIVPHKCLPVPKKPDLHWPCGALEGWIQKVNRIYYLAGRPHRFSTLKIPLYEAASTTKRKLRTRSQGNSTARSQIEAARSDQARILACDLVFHAHPALHRFPWEVEEDVANTKVVNRLKGFPSSEQSPFQDYRSLTRSGSTVQVAQGSVPSNTEYQVWVAYRVATAQLNLYHPGRQITNVCQLLATCSSTKETQDHIFWGCPCAQASWTLLLSLWMGNVLTPTDLKHYQVYCASRKAPLLSRTVKTRLQNEFDEEAPVFEHGWKRIWWIMATACITVLWMQRNRVVHHGEEVTVDSTTLGLPALAKRERRHLHTKITRHKINALHRSVDQASTRVIPLREKSTAASAPQGDGVAIAK
ncbi:hypothetical protein GQ600_23020 [Phytophthora cactorum]|nr:hypothetical protein GQ600_23020 [Phytophthora cactorum]